jgi:ammonia channel protein AmtB
MATPMRQHSLISVIDHSLISIVLRTGLALFAASIVSQVAAERLKTFSWPVYLLFFLGWIYPVQAHWSLGHGWLLKL